MPSSDLIQSTSGSPFENIDIINSDAFDPFEEFQKGTKDTKGQVSISAKDILNGTAGAGSTEDEEGKQVPEVDLDDFIEKSFTGNKGAATETEDEDEEGDDKGEAGDDKDPETGEVNPKLAYYNLMVSEGLWKAVDGFDGSDEKFDEAKDFNSQAIREEEVEAFLDEAFEKNPDGKEYGKALLNHLALGGRVSDFVSLYGADDINADDLDNEDVAIAERTAANIFSEYHSRIGWKPEKIAAAIRTKKEKGLLIDAAKDVAEPYNDLITEQKEQTRVVLENQRKQAKLNAQNYQKTVLSLVENETIRNITIGKTKQERQALADYMLKPTVETENGKISQIHADIREVQKDPEWNVVLAKTLYEFKNKTSKTEDKKEKQPKAADSIKEILKNSSTKVIQSASSDIQETPRRASVSKAWSGLS